MKALVILTWLLHLRRKHQPGMTDHHWQHGHLWSTPETVHSARYTHAYTVSVFRWSLVGWLAIQHNRCTGNQPKNPKQSQAIHLNTMWIVSKIPRKFTWNLSNEFFIDPATMLITYRLTQPHDPAGWRATGNRQAGLDTQLGMINQSLPSAAVADGCNIWKLGVMKICRRGQSMF